MGYYSLGALALLAEPGHHLSYPRGSSLNDGISSDYTTVSYATVENAIGLIKSVGPNCFLAKTDVKNAFRLVPIRPEDYDLMGIYWQLAIGNCSSQVLMGTHFFWLISGKILISWNCIPTPLVPWVTVLSLSLD